MSDTITGIAILDRAMVPQRLIVQPTRGDGKFCNPIVIAAYPKGSTKPAGVACEYEVRGDRLHVTPSLHVRHQNPLTLEWVTDFHNGYAWDVQFVEADSRSDDPKWPTKHLHEQLRRVNQK